MKKNFDDIDKVLNTTCDIVETSIEKDLKKSEIEVIEDEHISVEQIAIDLKKDYEYTRANLYSLIEKGQEAINGILELAGESDSPRAYEVAGQLIKSVGDVSDKLMDLQKKLKDVEENVSKTTNNTVNNTALFVGSTAELSKILKQGFLNSKEDS